MIPTRFAMPRPREDDVREMCTLCDAIENAAIAGAPELRALLARWNARAWRAYEPIEFRAYYGAMSTRAFVEQALSPKTTFVADLQFDEAVGVLDAIAKATLSEAETAYFVRWLDTQFVGGQASDLIFWPDVWFDDDAALQHPFTPAQLVTALSIRAGRTLPGAPAIELPFAVRAPVALGG